jgi:hypothetical protein
VYTGLNNTVFSEGKARATAFEDLVEYILRGQRIERGGLFLIRGQIFPCCGFRVKNSFSSRVSWWMGLSESIWWSTYLEDRG